MSHGVLIAPPRYAPQIAIEPPDEREGREHINLLLVLACQYVNRFAKALSLVRHCEPLVGNEYGLEPAEWVAIAVRDAALSIYHFKVALRAIRTELAKSPTLQLLVDTVRIREAERVFKRSFPDARDLRDAVSHTADQLSTPERMDELRRPGEFLAWETMVGGYFTMASRRGRQVRLSVDEQSLARLQAVLEEVVAAFEGANPTWFHACG